MISRWTTAGLAAALLWSCAADPPSSAPDMAGGNGAGQPAVVQGGAGGAAAVSCDAAPGYAEVSAFMKCSMCHSSARPAAERSGAPAAIDFDSEAAARANARAAQRMVSGGFMPPPGSGITLTNAEKQQLYTWAMCVE